MQVTHARVSYTRLAPSPAEYRRNTSKGPGLTRAKLRSLNRAATLRAQTPKPTTTVSRSLILAAEQKRARRCARNLRIAQCHG
jgi:hypothetical protein